MAPALATKNFTDRASVDAVAGGDVLVQYAGRGDSEDQRDICRYELGMSSTFAARHPMRHQMRPMTIAARQSLRAYRGAVSIAGSLSSLCHHVGGVIGAGAQEQMSRIHAGSIVAFVQHPKPGGYFAEMVMPGQSVRQPCDLSERRLSISILEPRTLPFPAFMRCAASYAAHECVQRFAFNHESSIAEEGVSFHG